MNFLEKSLEDIISKTPNHLLNGRGLPIKGKKKRQVRIGNYGISFTKHNNFKLTNDGFGNIINRNKY